MSAVSGLVRLFAAMDDRLERVLPTRWGAVVTDPRFPLIYDVNCARVDRGDGVSLADVRDVLVPAVHAAGAVALHVVTFDPQGSRPLLDELEAAEWKFNYDTVMRWRGPLPELCAAHEVVLLDPTAGGFWREQAVLLPELDIRGEVLEQYLDWQRAVLVPFGKRWFGVREEGLLLGCGALVELDGVAYVDDVVTARHARRRGIASSVVAHLVEEARASAGTEIFLLADEPGPIRLYERLGFVEVGLAVGAVLPLR